jgi:hypothetical protein
MMMQGKFTRFGRALAGLKLAAAQPLITRGLPLASLLFCGSVVAEDRTYHFSVTDQVLAGVGNDRVRYDTLLAGSASCTAIANGQQHWRFEPLAAFLEIQGAGVVLLGFGDEAGVDLTRDPAGEALHVGIGQEDDALGRSVAEAVNRSRTAADDPAKVVLDLPFAEGLLPDMLTDSMTVEITAQPLDPSPSMADLVLLFYEVRPLLARTAEGVDIVLSGDGFAVMNVATQTPLMIGSRYRAQVIDAAAQMHPVSGRRLIVIQDPATDAPLLDFERVPALIGLLADYKLLGSTAGPDAELAEAPDWLLGVHQLAAAADTLALAAAEERANPLPAIAYAALSFIASEAIEYATAYAIEATLAEAEEQRLGRELTPAERQDIARAADMGGNVVGLAVSPGKAAAKGLVKLEKSLRGKLGAAIRWGNDSDFYRAAQKAAQGAKVASRSKLVEMTEKFGDAIDWLDLSTNLTRDTPIPEPEPFGSPAPPSDPPAEPFGPPAPPSNGPGEVFGPPAPPADPPGEVFGPPAPASNDPGEVFGPPTPPTGEPLGPPAPAVLPGAVDPLQIVREAYDANQGGLAGFGQSSGFAFTADGTPYIADPVVGMSIAYVGTDTQLITQLLEPGLAAEVNRRQQIASNFQVGAFRGSAASFTLPASTGGFADVSLVLPLSFRVFDFGSQDGDRVRIELRSLDGAQVLAGDLSLLNAGTLFNPVISAGPVELQLTALNEGSLSPNTGGLNILSNVTSGPANQQFNLLTGESGTLRIIAGP